MILLFLRFTEEHDFIKPNDIRGIDLMNDAAISVMKEFKDIVIAFGESDEYSFVFKRDTDLWNRRSELVVFFFFIIIGKFFLVLSHCFLHLT